MLVPRPVCDVYAASASHGNSAAHGADAHLLMPQTARHVGMQGPCCASLHEAALVKTFDRALAQHAEAQPVAAAGVRDGHTTFSSRTRPARVALGDLSPPRSYYARSARIQR